MGSQSELPPLWQSWDSCRVFSATECSIKNSRTLDVKAVTLENAVNQASILAFCQDRQVSERALFELAWCIAVGAYAGVEDVCIGVRTSDGQNLLRCRLDPQQSTGSHLSSMDEIALASNSNEEDLADLVNSTGLFDTILSIGDSGSGSAANGAGLNGVRDVQSSVSRSCFLGWGCSLNSSGKGLYECELPRGSSEFESRKNRDPLSIQHSERLVGYSSSEAFFEVYHRGYYAC